MDKIPSYINIIISIIYMKKAIITGILMAAAMTAAAENARFVFVTNRGEHHVMESTGLVITFEEGTLVATNSSQTLSLHVSTLASMGYTDEEPNQDSIKEIFTGKECAYYSTDGVEQGKFASIAAARKALKPGVYVIKSNGASLKIVLK